MARPRKTKADDDEQVNGNGDDGNGEEQDQDRELDETEVEQEVEDAGGSSGLNLRVLDDRVEIDLPRDGNERKTLDALGKLLDGMG